jgi:CheY-like chemotaxis protein
MRLPRKSSLTSVKILDLPSLILKAEQKLKEQPRPTALVVDENVHVSSHISGILELSDCEAIPVASAQECVDMLNRLHNNKKVDAVILSGTKAIRKGGFLISHIKKLDKKIKTLAIVRDKGDRHMLLSAGADAVATKPVTRQTLAFKVLKLVTSDDLDMNR